MALAAQRIQLEQGYKQTEVGLVPKDWDVKQIRDVCSLINGRGFKPHEWQTAGLPIIRIQNLNGSEDFNYYSGPYNPKILIEHGQLLFAWSGSRGTSFGPHIWNGGRALLNYHTWKVVVNESRTDPQFLFHALRYLTSYIEARAHGASALVHVQKWETEKLPIPIPSDLAEQRAIAAVLGDVDILVSSLDHLIAKKRSVKQATMQQLLTGRTRLPGFSEKWDVKRLGDIVQFLGSANNPRSELSAFGQVKYLHYGDIHTKWRGFLDCSRDDLPRIQEEKVRNIPFLEDGDLVMADASEDTEGIGVSVEVKNATGQKVVAGLHTFVLRAKKSELANGFKGYLQYIPAVKDTLRKAATGISVYGISKTSVGNVNVRLPDAREQVAIAAILADMDAEIAALEQHHRKTQAIKQGMMQELLTGRRRLV